MQKLLFILLVVALLTSACQLNTPAPNQPGEPLFADDFSNPAGGWERFSSAEGTMDYDGSGYRFLVNGLQTNFWSTPGKSFGDVRVEVDVAKVGGPDENRIGLLCRFTEGNYYFFMVSSDGYYTIGKYISAKVTQLGQGQMQFSNAVHTGLAVNHLRVDCVGSVITFTINGNLVAQAQDDDLHLRAGGLEVCHLINFGKPKVEIKGLLPHVNWKSHSPDPTHQPYPFYLWL